MTRKSLRTNVRALAKQGIATCLHRTGVNRLVGAWRGVSGTPLVIGYHRVVEDFGRSIATSIPPMLTSERTFERHLDWIGKRYRFVSLDELAVALRSGGANGKPVAAITFDDGYRDVFQNAFPILERKGIPFAIFVVTDLVGTSRLQTHDEIYLLLSRIFARPEAARQAFWRELTHEFASDAEARKRIERMLTGFHDPFTATRAALNALPHPEIRDFVHLLRSRIPVSPQEKQSLQSVTWDMLREMAAHGVTVGSHTKSHLLLSHENPRLVREEVEDSRLEIEQRLGTPARHFAYPDGRFDDRTVRAVAKAGYRTAYTTCRHRDERHPLLTIPRNMLWENACTDRSGRFSPAIFACQVNGIFDAADKCRQRHLSNDPRRVKVIPFRGRPSHFRGTP